MADAKLETGMRGSAYGLVLLIAAIVLIVVKLPSHVWDAADSSVILTLGSLAAWRYGWWLMHLVRANIYARLVFPKLRKRADALWSSGWKPPFVHFLVPTFKERPEITEAVLESIFAECRGSQVPARIF